MTVRIQFIDNNSMTGLNEKQRSRVFGPFDWIKMDGNKLLAPDGMIIAECTPNGWLVDGIRYSHVSIA